MKVFAFGFAARNGFVAQTNHPSFAEDTRQVLAQLLKRSDPDGSFSVIYDPAGDASRITEMTGYRRSDSVDILESRRLQRTWVDLASPRYFDLSEHVEALYLLRFDRGTETFDPSIKWLSRWSQSSTFHLSHAGEKLVLCDAVEARVEIYRRRILAGQS